MLFSLAHAVVSQELTLAPQTSETDVAVLWPEAEPPAAAACEQLAGVG